MQLEEAVKILKDELTCWNGGASLEECCNVCENCRFFHTSKELVEVYKVVLPVLKTLIEKDVV